MNSRYTYPPQVPRWVSIRNALRMVQNPIPILSDNVAHYGKSYTFHVGGVQKGIVTTEPGFIQHILQKNHRNYRKTYIQTDILGHYIGLGLLTSDGPYWLQQRRLIQPAFHREKLEHIVSIMAEETKAYFHQHWHKGDLFDVYREMHTLAFRIVARALFGTEVTEEVLTTLSRNITLVQSFVTRRIRQPYLHAWFKYGGAMQKYDSISDESRRILLDLIRQRMQSGEVYSDLLDLLLNSRYEDTGEPMSETQILDESLILFVAGHETTANALTWCLYLLSQHPDWFEAVRSEVESMPSTFQELMQLQLTKQVIQETMRLYPPGWIIDRVSIDDDEILGYRYPGNTFTIQYIYGVHHDPDLWPDPEKFDPDRFTPENEKSRVPYSYLPFGGGPRLCIGNQFAMLEMLLVLSYVVKHFDIEFTGDTPEMLPLVTLRPKKAVMMRLGTLPSAPSL